MMTRQYPIIVIVRDRLSHLQQLLAWLDNVGQRNIWLCDNASTYAVSYTHLTLPTILLV